MVVIGQSNIVRSTSQISDNAIATADITDGAVTPAKLENGTRGDILYAGVGGVFARLAAGALGFVLQANGAGTDPSWVAASTLPAGVIAPYGAASAPSGWLLCDGSVVSQATYATLYALIGHTYAADPGGGNFTLPNLKGKVPVGFNSAETEFDALGETGGAKTHTLQISEMPAHTHPVGIKSYTANGTTSIGGGNGSNDNSIAAAASTTGGGGSHNNLQPYITLTYIIKT